MIHYKQFDNLGVRLSEGVSMSGLTTFQLGGTCPLLIDCASSVQVEEVIRLLIADGQDYLLIGGGSNLLVSDKGVDCAVVRYLAHEPVIKRQGREILVDAGTLLDDLARAACEQGLTGFACFSGIPGTVGGAVVGNAGAWGRQVSDFLKSLRLISSQGQVRESAQSEIEFSYRHSSLKNSGDVVLQAVFACDEGDAAALIREREDILEQRRVKHPDLSLHPCAGSFFRNIEPTSSAEKRQAAGWFLEQAGALSLSVGGARVFPKHANIIIKGESCTASDVDQLATNMARAVKDKFGLDLIREVRLIGEF